MSTELSSQLRERIENTIRCLTLDAVQTANSGHVGAPMGLARPAFELWDRHLRFDPSDPNWPLRDRFVLSAGHASMLLYSLLHLFGCGLTLEDIEAFRKLGSKTPGHPEYGLTPGVETTTGPLGQGFGNAVGMALAGPLARARFGSEQGGPGHHFVYGIASDGDLMEGVASEAASLAGHLGLRNLIFLYDDNQVTIDGPTNLCFRENVAQRFEAYGWHVASVDGERLDDFNAALAAARAEVEKPSLIVTATKIGFGIPGVEGKAKAHGNPLDKDGELRRQTKQNLHWPVDNEFYVPDEVAGYLAERIQAKQKERREIDAAGYVWRAAEPERAAAWDAARERKLPANLGALLSEGLEGVANPTRKHSGAVLEKLSQLVPYMVGGSSDLAGSGAPPLIKSSISVGPSAGAGEARFVAQNIHFGVREHGMGAISNGLALDGTFIPYSGTFLIFSDYMRPAIRLSALMGLREIFVFTHDSIFLGEDGPTHQPIEQLDSLRAVPGLPVFRPADGIETAMAYAWILQHAEGPALLALSRQTLPALVRDPSFEPEDVWKGAYLVKAEGAGKGGKVEPSVVLLATGSEVALACEASLQLETAGNPTRVVSVPCLERFLEQPDAYREELLPEGALLVAVEAGAGGSFWRVIGNRGFVYGIERFGASAPEGDLAAHFGFTPDALAASVKSELGLGGT